LLPVYDEMTDSEAQVFDKQRVRKAFDRAAETYDAAAVLQKEVCKRLLEKLEFVNLSPARVLDAGTGTGEAILPLQQRFKNIEVVTLDISEKMLLKIADTGTQKVCGDIEALPFTDQCFDLVFSNLMLQWCNDLSAAFAECKRVLKPGGLLLFTTFGPDTLKELRASWQQVDAAVHVNAFLDMHDIGDGLLHTGFAEPVMEAEHITVNYQDVDTLMHDLRAIGANVTSNGHRQGLLTPNLLAKLRASYERFRRGHDLPATYEIIYGHAWQPEAGAVPVEFRR